MPKAPKGGERLADVVGNAVLIGKIATGEITEAERVKSAAAELGSNGPRRELRPSPRRSARTSPRWLPKKVGLNSLRVAVKKNIGLQSN